MIDVIKYTPAEYSSQSRDYQVIARLYSALFNISKMYIDNLRIWNNDIDNKLITLRSKTLNFDARHSWDENDLEAVTSCFKYLMRNKGTMKALEECVNILMRVQNLSGDEVDNPITIANYHVTIRIPQNLVALGVLEDLVDYLLPAGLTYDIRMYKTSAIGNLLHTEIEYIDISYDSEGNHIENINAIEEQYSNKMYIGSNKDLINDDSKFELDLKDAIINLGMFGQDYAPIDDDKDIKWNYVDPSTGITAITTLDNDLVIKDSEGKTYKIIVTKENSDKIKYITDTFIYLRKDVGDKYEEKWKDD